MMGLHTATFLNLRVRQVTIMSAKRVELPVGEEAAGEVVVVGHTEWETKARGICKSVDIMLVHE